MDIILKQSISNVRMYIDNKIVAIFDDATVDDVVEWIKRNFLNVRIYTS